MDKRIFITGPSGMGKTTVAKYIEETYGIPFISTSAKKLWPRYGFKDHAQAHQISTIDPARGLEYQLSIIHERFNSLYNKPSWVCDRSPIDNFIYFMTSISALTSDEESEMFFERIQSLMRLGNAMIIIPYSKEIKLNDEFRIKNRYYHQMTNSIMEWGLWSNLVNSHLIPNKLRLNSWDINTRKELIDQWLKS